MKRSILLTATAAFFLLSKNLSAQTIDTTISGIINRYARITAFDTCDARLTLSDTVGFRRGTRVLIFQMNGATIRETNNSQYGTINNLNATGKYEVNFIDSLAGNVAFLRFFLKNTYQTNAALQAVTYPSWRNVTVADTLRAKAWDGNSGGIIAFEAVNLTLNSAISASATGFRGGAVKVYSLCDALENYSDYYYPIGATNKNTGAPKGEGIAALIIGKECGRGAQANGGGGGNNHKAGGGGGSHLATGGDGGSQKHVNFIRNCNGDWPGVAGVGISTTEAERLFFGGGGGAGHNRENGDSRGGIGGGIIVVKANSLIANGKTVAANGQNGIDNLTDGGGGGGAGGTVLLLASQITGALNVEAKGGTGASTFSITEYDFGPGGGGAGGRILYTNAIGITSVVTGALPGKNSVQRIPQGATKGNDGSASALAAAFALPARTDSVSRKLTIKKQPTTTRICEYTTTTLDIQATGTDLSYEWQINRGDGRGFVPLSSDTTFIGVNAPSLLLFRVRTTLNPFLFRCVVTGNCSSRSTVASDSIGLIILPAPIAAFTANIAGNTVSFSNGSSNGARFIWDFGDGRTDTTASPTHTYTGQGDYIVVLKTINSCDTNIARQTIRLNTKPRADFTSTTTDYCVPASVAFTNASSNNVVSYQWVFAGGNPATSAAQNPSVVYPAAGIFDVVLVVTNANGRDTLRRTSYIRVNAPPATRFTSQINGNNPTVSFQNQTVGATSFSWNFGDGGTVTEVNPQHTYATSGTFVVVLTATNACGTTSYQDTVRRLSLPSATISASNPQGCSPFIVQFAGQNPSNVSRWQWEFPGGTPATSSLANPRIVYNTAGTYGVSLTVANAAGIYTTTQADYIKVVPPPVADFTFRVDSVMAFFQNNSTGATNYRWDFGDGTSSSDLNPPRHEYRRNGNYEVTLQALNSICGAATVRQVTIFVVGTSDVPNTEGSVLAAPNPTTGKLQLLFQPPPTIDFQLVIANANGQILKNQALSREAVQDVDLSEMPSGVYFLHFRTAQESFVKKVIKF